MRLSWPKRWQKKTHLSRELLLYSPKDFFISLLLYAASVFVCLILRHFDTSKATSYVAMIFLLDVFLTAFFTDGFLFSLLDAVLGVLSVDYIFTEPYWHISFTLSGVPVTFLVMMTISILTGILTSRAKQLDAVSREAEREKLYAGLLRAVSHDIRTPLTGIVGATNVLLEQEETITPAQRHELIQSANQEAQWLIRIVENLLSITRIGAENACVTKTPEAARRSSRARSPSSAAAGRRSMSPSTCRTSFCSCRWTRCSSSRCSRTCSKTPRSTARRPRISISRSRESTARHASPSPITAWDCRRSCRRASSTAISAHRSRGTSAATWASVSPPVRRL